MAAPEIVVIGEALVEIMRPRVGIPLGEPGPFSGPFPSGAPAIFADAAARLGGAVAFVGVVGRDAFGNCVRDRLLVDGVDVSALRLDPDRATACAFVAYAADGSRSFLFHLRHAAAGALSPDDVPEAMIRTSRFVHVMGSSLAASLSSRAACYRAVALAKEVGASVSFDPNVRPELLGRELVLDVCGPVLQAADVVLPSGEEASMLAGVSDPLAAAQALAADGRTVALKRGVAGSVIFRGDQRLDVPSYPVTEVDPTGAGDCFGAAFVLGLIRGWPLERCARVANAVGALAVTALGPMEGAPTMEEALRLAGSG